MLRVAVIGAGAAGLCVGRHFLARSDVFQATVFEQTNRVGGTWVYNARTGVDENGLPVHSSMYHNLKTNLPKEVMLFPDYPFPENLKSYLTHSEVCKYLEDYAEHFGVLSIVEFNTTVEHIAPLNEDDVNNPRWEVTIRNLNSNKKSTSTFDAVVVCTGHYSVPRKPEIPGLSEFPGLVMHSHDYRHPEVFAGMDVVLLGAGASGQDISIDLASTANRIYLSHNRPRIPSKMPGNLEQHYGIKELTSDGKAVFKDGQERKVDALMFCTGYDFVFPFLDSKCGIKVTDNHITPLYQHMFNIKYPTMSFIGLPIKVCPFPQFHLQSEYIISMLTGKVKLPSAEEMHQSAEKEYNEVISEGMAEKYAHFLGPKQWSYNDKIADSAQCSRLSPMVEKLYKYTWKFRHENILTYKKREFRIVGDSFEDVSEKLGICSSE